jgi:SAM-dependent methyltransferase
MEYYKIKKDGFDYVWEPSMSTPSCKDPVAELPEVIGLLKSLNVKSVIDFGCGNGRNSKLLNEAFDRTLLVECIINVQKLRLDKEFKGYEIKDYESFKNQSTEKFDAAVLSFVLHTLPSTGYTVDILSLIKSKLKKGGLIVIISPKNDSKYTTSKTANLIKKDDGYIKTLKGGKYSYYKNLNQKTIIELLSEIKFEFESKILSASRNILIFKNI